MVEIPPLPKRLAESKDQIIEGFTKSPGGEYSVELWHNYLDNDSDLLRICQRFPTSIRRRDIEQLSIEAQSGGSAQIRTVFLASMIWGWGNRGLGPWQTKHMLNYDNLDTQLIQASESIANGMIVKAYIDFDVPHCGPAFFTKFFYFLGLGCQSTPLPLILDSRVASSLRTLSAEEGWQPELFVITGADGYVKSYVDGYWRYLQAIDYWSKQLGCRADNIEYFLFMMKNSTRGKDITCSD
jgi:hypothetical protein